MSKSKLGRVVRRHNRLVERRERLLETLQQMPDGQQQPVLALIDRILASAVDLPSFPPRLRDDVRGLPPLTIDALSDPKSPVAPALAKALQLASAPARAAIVAWAAAVGGWLGLLAGVLFDFALELGARFAVWVLLKIVVAGTREGRLDALEDRIKRLRAVATELAAEVGAPLTIAGGFLVTDDEALSDEGDEEVVGLLT